MNTEIALPLIQEKNPFLFSNFCEVFLHLLPASHHTGLSRKIIKYILLSFSS